MAAACRNSAQTEPGHEGLVLSLSLPFLTGFQVPLRTAGAGGAGGAPV